VILNEENLVRGGDMRIEDVMTSSVVTASPDTPLKTVAQQLSENRISGVPVVNDDGEVVGVISEADLLVKEAGSMPRRTGVFARLLDSTDPKEQMKLEARVASDAMTTPAVTVAPYLAIASAAARMLECGINRLPVVRSGKLVGIVTRADLVRAFARSDEQVLAEVREQVDYFLALAGDFSQVEANLTDGELKLSGSVRRRSSAEELPRFLGKVPGVVGVVSELTWLEDDSRPQRAPRQERVGEWSRYPA
jgi:CBS domain-containing protein